MTVQNLYTQYLDGKITKQKFLYEVRRDQNLDMISSSNSFDDVVKILKNKSIISEKAHKEAKLATGKQEVDIIAKTIDMVNPYEYTRGMNYELEILDIPASEGDLSEDNILKAQKKVLANLTKNSQYYGEKMHGKGEVGHEWIEATKKEIEKIGKGKSKMIREGVENGLKQMGYSDSDIEDFMDEYEQGGSKLPKKVKDYLDGLYQNKLGSLRTKSLRKESLSLSTREIAQALIPLATNKEEIKQYMQSLSKSGDKFETVDDYVEDFRNYVADKSLEEHGQYADRVADVNADSSPLKEKQEAIYKKYSESTGIPMENLMAMVREAKAKMKEGTTYAGKDAVDDAQKDPKFSSLSGTGKTDAINKLKQGNTVTIG
jgi:hypothetical protein